jgi:hypothetical protein
MLALSHAEVQSATQSANINDWSDPEKVLSQVDI